MNTTRAVVISAPQQLDLQTVELTPVGDDDLVVETCYTSISSGTERMLLAGRMPHPMLQFPVIPGYETVGRVVELGRNVPLELHGQLVYVGGARCFQGVNPAWGGQSAILITDFRRVVPLGAVPADQGVLLALAATALHGIDLLAPAADNRTLVLGQGPVGQIAARLARSHGAWVAVSDRVPGRLERSHADIRIDVGQTTLSSAIEAPVDMIIEATGSMAALAEALPLLADGGTILLLGYYDELRLPYMPLFLKQVRLLTAREWAAGDLVRCRDMMALGTLQVGELISHHMPIEQFAAAYHIALEEPECLKLVLSWS
ncbi:MAG TPA: zinc-binding dehydrogenase [Roseiflexaceae bacterium]|nr:zinc-binding dehydrogenase [Roseiflexaceae bacterium]HMP39158.1 zinc-binding dehydrogenase [Roseiflexaceae bacterium]